ncbi:T9SS type A sorting domain-containing protein [Patiriisocius marinus]|uniref:T9SS type A sorting domain-containing protein n=1 Tax=Patiriisocius marinus TaxID=1397112 RepID=UPI00232E01D2|nr:T9SS type A sorting domain-containing protein [Patiriisocius marinus]
MSTKNTLLLLLLIFGSLFSTKAQFTETFEALPVGATVFTNAGRTFTTTGNPNYSVEFFDNAGAADSDFFLSNINNIGVNQTNVIALTGGGTAFTMKSMEIWVSSRTDLVVPTNDGTMTFTGKLGGVTQFSFTKTTGYLTTNTGPQNGFFLMDFAASGSGDFSNINIDRIEVTQNGPFIYNSIDNFVFDDPAAAADPPEVNSITIVGNPPTTTTSLQFLVNFTENAFNVSLDDFLLDTVGTTGVLSSISGSGSIYTVNVTNITGEGTMSLDLKANTNIVDAESNGPPEAFTNGEVQIISRCFIETFEDTAAGDINFNSNGVSFTTGTSNFDIEFFNNAGADDSDYFLSNFSDKGVNKTYSITTTGSENFQVEQLSLYLSSLADGSLPTNDGTVSITGKLNGIQQYVITKNNGFPTALGVNNGFVQFDFATAGAGNYAIINIDELELSIGGSFSYIVADNFEHCEELTNANPPITQSISLVGDPAASSTSVSYTVLFNEDAFNVSVDDFTLTTDNVSATIASVSGTGNVYTVLINTISGEGSLRLDLLAGTNISDVDGNSPADPFTEGEVHFVSSCLIESFESLSVGATSWTTGGTPLTTGTSNFSVIEFLNAGAGGSDRFLDNDSDQGLNKVYTVSITNTETVNAGDVKLYLSSLTDGEFPTNDGTITIRGILDGVTVFTVNKTSGFPTVLGVEQGFFSIDFTSEGGVDNSGFDIDALQFELGGSFSYIGLDNFKICGDLNPPTAICQDIIVQLDGNGNTSITAEQVDNGSSDGEGGVALSLDITNFDCSNIGANTVILTITDEAGNIDTCTATVTVADNVAPNAICQDVMASLDVNGEALVSPSAMNYGSTDACSLYLGFETITFKAAADISNSDDLSGGTIYYVNSSKLIVQNAGNYIFNATSENTSSDVVFMLFDQEVPANSGYFSSRPGYLGFINYSQDGIFVSGDGVGLGGSLPLEASKVYYLLTFNAFSQTEINSTVTVNNPVITTDDKVYNCSSIGVNSETLFAFDSSGNFDTCTANVTVAGTVREYSTGGWVNGDLPDLSSKVIISADYNSAIEGSIEGCACTIENNATLTIKEDTYLRTERNIFVSAGASLIVEHRGSVVQDRDDAIVTNNGTVEVMVTSPLLDPRVFMVLGSPVTNNRPAVVENTGPIVTREFFRILKHSTADFTPNADVQALFMDGTNFVDEEGDDFTPLVGVMNPGEGYYSMPQPSLLVGGEQYDMLFKQTGVEGTLNTGTLTYSLGYNGDKNSSPNLLANPYPSAISAMQFILANDAVDEVYFWEHRTTPNATFPGWNDVNFDMGDISTFNSMGLNVSANGTGSTAGTIPNDFPISTAQGFGVKNNGAVTGTGQTATFTNTMRLTDNNTTLRTPEFNKDRIWLKVENSEFQLQSTTLVGFVEDGTPGFEAKYDSPRVGTPVSIYSHIIDGSEQLVIQGRESFTEEKQVSIGFSSQIDQVNTAYIISVENLEGNLIEQATVYLKDTFLNTVHNISETPYHFVSSIGTFNNRFVLQFMDESVLNIPEIALSIVQLYPNPTEGIVTINSPQSLITSIKVTDILGRVVQLREAINANATTIDISEKANAVYFVEIHTEAGKITKRLIKDN